METYYQMLKEALGMFLFLGAELAGLFILISFGVSLVQQYIPDEKIQKMLSEKKGWGYGFAAALGAVTPFCSCSTIPMLRGLLKAKAGFGPTMTFLLCSPLLNPIIMGLFVATFGLKVTLYYMAIALIVSIAAAFTLDALQFEKYVIPEAENPGTCCACAAVDEHPAKSNDDNKATRQNDESTCCSTATAKITDCRNDKDAPATSCCENTTTPPVLKPPFALRCKFAYWEAINQFKAVSIYLLIGVALGAFVYGFVPSEFIAAHARGTDWYAIPIAAVIGIPLYVRTEVLIPLSAALADKGMGMGAIMALIIGGGGASITELILLKSMFRMPMLIAFLAVILGMAVSAGMIFQYAL